MRAGYQGEPATIAEAAAEFARRAEAPVLAAAATRFGTALAGFAALGRRTRVSATMLH